MLRRFAMAALAVPSLMLTAVLAGGYLGDLHPLGDSLAVFRAHAAFALAGCGLLLMVLRAWSGAAMALGLACLAGVPVLAMALPARTADAAPGITVYTKNMLFGRGDNPELVADIRASGADLILLQELNAERGTLLEALGESHPHQHICQFSTWSGIAILSRWPLDEPHCSVHRTLAAARVATPEGPVWAVSAHLLWPYPYGQRHALDHEMAFLQGLSGAIVVGGDFNMAPWGQSVRDMAAATGTELLGPIHVTIAPRGVPLSIDHILSTGEGQVIRRPRFGSDHYGLLAQIGWSD